MTAPVRLRAVWAAALVTTLAGCASVPVADRAERESLYTSLRERGLDPRRVVIPYGLNDEIREWVDQRVSSVGSDREQLDRLSEILLASDAMRLDYEWGSTGTAVEVFESRRANCLAFTNLFYGVARELEIDVEFVLVARTENFLKSGNLVFVTDHIAVAHEEGTDRRIYDFAEVPTDEPQYVRPITDLQAMALFYSNRGIEKLHLGEANEAVESLRTAVRLEPSFARSWTNLGVALRRTGDLVGAEEAHRKAIELDPTLFSAYQNLAALMRVLHRIDEAEALEAFLADASHRNPYTFLHLGDLSRARGELDEADRFYRRAADLHPDCAECLAARGLLALERNEPETARRLLRKARRVDPDEPRTRELEGRLSAPAS